MGATQRASQAVAAAAALASEASVAGDRPYPSRLLDDCAKRQPGRTAGRATYVPHRTDTHGPERTTTVTSRRL